MAPEFLVELDHIAELIVSGAGNIKTWGPGSDVQRLRMRLNEGGRAHVNPPAPNGYSVACRQNLGHGSIEGFVQQPRAAFGVQMQVLHQHRPIVDRTNAADQENRLAGRNPQRLAMPNGGEDTFTGEDRGAGNPSLGQGVLGKAQIRSGVVAEPWRRHEPTTPVQAINEPFGLELEQRLTDRHPRDSESLPHGPLRRQLALRREGPGLDQRREMVANAEIIGNPAIPGFAGSFGYRPTFSHWYSPSFRHGRNTM